MNKQQKLSKEQRIMFLTHEIYLMIYDYDWTIEDKSHNRENSSNYALELLTKCLGIKTKPNKYPNLTKMINIEMGDDEPFSDCGIDKDELTMELIDIQKSYGVKYCE